MAAKKRYYEESSRSSKSGKDIAFSPEKDSMMRSMEQYAGPQLRRKMEMEDGGMIYDDLRAIANLPQEVMIKPYPKTGPYLPEGLDDSIRGVDEQMDYDDSQRRRHFNPKKV